MLTRKYIFVLLFVLSVFGNLLAQNPSLDKIDVADLTEHLVFLASDRLQGRAYGTETDGLSIAAEYLKEQARKKGLHDPGMDYFQKFDIQIIKPGGEATFEISLNHGEKVSEKKVVHLNRESGNYNKHNLEVVFAGFGTDSINIENLSEISLKGKVVLVSQGDETVFSEGKDIRWNNRLERKKFERISALGPEAIVMVTLPSDKKQSTYNRIRNWMNRKRYAISGGKKECPVLIATPQFAELLFNKKDSWEETVKKYISNKNTDLIFGQNKINLEIVSNSEIVEGKNVIGIVQGSDPVLKEECVILMAHYDHLGVDKNGEVFNGADDNGSGSVLLLEVAEAFSSMKVKPKRSIVFLWLAAEEIGLLGSQYYTENPVFPLEKTKACINIDMAGRVYEPRDSVLKKSPKLVKDFNGLYTLSNDVWPEIKEINLRNCEKLGIVPDTSLPSYFLRSSDHYHFHNNGVPILNYATGYHADYHKVGDEVEKINFQKLKRVADLCFMVALEIANSE